MLIKLKKRNNKTKQKKKKKKKKKETLKLLLFTVTYGPLLSSFGDNLLASLSKHCVRYCPCYTLPKLQLAPFSPVEACFRCWNIVLTITKLWPCIISFFGCFFPMKQKNRLESNISVVFSKGDRIVQRTITFVLLCYSWDKIYYFPSSVETRISVLFFPECN